jgi:hypothetical protein
MIDQRRPIVSGSRIAQHDAYALGTCVDNSFDVCTTKCRAKILFVELCDDKVGDLFDQLFVISVKRHI